MTASSVAQDYDLADRGRRCASVSLNPAAGGDLRRTELVASAELALRLTLPKLLPGEISARRSLAAPCGRPNHSVWTPASPAGFINALFAQEAAMRALGLATQADPRTRPWTGGRRAGWRLSVAGRGADAAAHRARRTRTRRRREGRGQPPKSKEGALLSLALSDLGLSPACPGGPGRTCTGRLGPPTSAGVRERPHTDDVAMGTALPPAPLGLARGPRQSWPECPRPLLLLPTSTSGHDGGPASRDGRTRGGKALGPG